MEVIVIGGGASGLVAAITAARCGARVTILEKNSKVGKKLLLTGNGRCNFWHENLSINDYLTDSVDKLKEIIDNTSDKVLPFFEILGIVPRIINGYYYPFSNQATSIVNALIAELNILNVTIKLDTVVEKITKENKFIVTTNKGIYTSDKVIMACGSKAAPKTGSNGEGYKLVQNLGHSLNNVYPALVSLKGTDNFYKDWAGVRSEVKLTLNIENKKIKEETGEIQFTKDGISGICTFNLSNYVAKSLDQNKKVIININFVPWFKGSINDLKIYFDEVSQKRPNILLVNILEGFLNYKIVNLLLKMIKARDNEKWTTCNQNLLLNLLVGFPFEVKETALFEDAQVCGGGIPLKEINPLTMESTKVKGLYLTGEILDVVGFCGGYNLGFAWMSGILSGKDVAND